MKKIIKRVPARVQNFFQCDICKAKYRSAEKARQCESRIIEEKHFMVGDDAMWREQRFCQNKQKHYWMHGKIVKIFGPMVPDFEYNAKWLGGVLSGMHAFMYEIRWKCPLCHETRDGQFYSPELKKIKTR